MGFLTGKTAIITGAGRAVLSDGKCGSIGYGIATAYAKEGAKLVITGRNTKKLADEDHKEQIRRFAEVANLMLDAGMVLIVTATGLTESDRKIMKTVIQGEMDIIWVGDKVSTDIKADVQLKDSDFDYSKNINKIKTMLKDKGIIFS